MMDLTQKQWVSHVVFHPFEGYEDLRWKKGGSLKIAFLIVFLSFLSMLASARLYGFQFVVSYDKTFNIIPYLVQSIGFFAVWVVGNWAISTWLDGEGSMKNICIYSAYALIPYVAQQFICVILSHLLIRGRVRIHHCRVRHWHALVRGAAVHGGQNRASVQLSENSGCNPADASCHAGVSVPACTPALSVPAGLRIRLLHLHGNRIPCQGLRKGA